MRSVLLLALACALAQCFLVQAAPARIPVATPPAQERRATEKPSLAKLLRNHQVQAAKVQQQRLKAQIKAASTSSSRTVQQYCNRVQSECFKVCYQQPLKSGQKNRQIVYSCSQQKANKALFDVGCSCDGKSFRTNVVSGAQPAMPQGMRVAAVVSTSTSSVIRTTTRTVSTVIRKTSITTVLRLATVTSFESTLRPTTSVQPTSTSTVTTFVTTSTPEAAATTVVVVTSASPNPTQTASTTVTMPVPTSTVTVNVTMADPTRTVTSSVTPPVPTALATVVRTLPVSTVTRNVTVQATVATSRQTVKATQQVGTSTATLVTTVRPPTSTAGSAKMVVVEAIVPYSPAGSNHRSSSYSVNWVGRYLEYDARAEAALPTAEEICQSYKYSCFETCGSQADAVCTGPRSSSGGFSFGCMCGDGRSQSNTALQAISGKLRAVVKPTAKAKAVVTVVRTRTITRSITSVLPSTTVRTSTRTTTLPASVSAGPNANVRPQNAVTVTETTTSPYTAIVTSSSTTLAPATGTDTVWDVVTVSPSATATTVQTVTVSPTNTVIRSTTVTVSPKSTTTNTRTSTANPSTTFYETKTFTYAATSTAVTTTVVTVPVATATVTSTTVLGAAATGTLKAVDTSYGLDFGSLTSQVDSEVYGFKLDQNGALPAAQLAALQYNGAWTFYVLNAASPGFGAFAWVGLETLQQGDYGVHPSNELLIVANTMLSSSPYPARSNSDTNAFLAQAATWSPGSNGLITPRWVNPSGSSTAGAGMRLFAMCKTGEYCVMAAADSPSIFDQYNTDTVTITEVGFQFIAS